MKELKRIHDALVYASELFNDPDFTDRHQRLPRTAVLQRALADLDNVESALVEARKLMDIRWTSRTQKCIKIIDDLLAE